MQPCHDTQLPDLLLDGHAWQFTSLRDAVQTYRKLRAYRGAQWPDLAATCQRLFATATPDEQAWYHREQARLGGRLSPQSGRVAAVLDHRVSCSLRQPSLLEDTP